MTRCVKSVEHGEFTDALNALAAEIATSPLEWWWVELTANPPKTRDQQNAKRFLEAAIHLQDTIWDIACVYEEDNDA